MDKQKYSSLMKRQQEGVTQQSTKRTKIQRCVYLDTVNRQLLDFDFEKVLHD